MGYERIKNLEKIFKISREEAKEIDSLMTGIRKVSGNKVDKMLKRINKLIGGYGVEPIRNESQETVALYINMGNTYDTTILFNRKTKMPMITTMGDFVERNILKYKII